MITKGEILRFIKSIRISHSYMIDIFTKGSCMNFHIILDHYINSHYDRLVKVFPYYNGDHIISKIEDCYFDITGEVKFEGNEYTPYSMWMKEGDIGTIQMLDYELPIDKYYCDSNRHLVCIPYSIENLHKMAKKLDIKKCWFHKDHYDIPKKRVIEIMNKCKLVSNKTIWTIINEL